MPGPSKSNANPGRAAALNPRLTIGLTALILVAIVLTGIVVIWRYADSERSRELYEWQLRLGLVADSRAAAVEDWLATERGVIEGLAQNTSLRLYVTTLTSDIASGDKAGETGYAAEYLATLLKATAFRSGFDVAAPDANLPANTPRPHAAGLAILDASGKLLAGTAGMPDLDGSLLATARAASGETASLIDVFAGPENQASLGFAAAIYGVQADPGSAMPIGYVVGIRRLAPDLWTRLSQPGDVAKTGQTYLVRRSGASIEFLSPLADGAAPLSRMVAADTPGFAARYAIDFPGGFKRARNYADTDVLVTGRKLTGAPWTLVRTVNAEEALGAIDARRWRLIVMLGLLGMATGLGFLLVWRHAVSVRLARTAAENERLADLQAHLSAFLKLVTDSQPTAIAVVDADDHYRFANARAAEEAGVASEDLDGKTLAAVLGPARAEPLAKINRAVIETGETATGVFEWPGEAGMRHVKYDHIRVALEPGESSGGLGVLMVHEDITGLVAERERRERSLRALVSALIMIIDKRDPYSAEHSIRVSNVAGLIAREMGLSKVEIETVQLAAALINVGKIFIPREVLTKSGPLSDDELGLVRENIIASADLLADVEFDGPVVETIRQVHEHWDGSGKPAGLDGEAILATARVVAVANAFVGMVSPRAYRDALSLDSAVAALMDKTNMIYDRRPVVALAHILDNRGGRQLWARFGEVAGQAGS